MKEKQIPRWRLGMTSVWTFMVGACMLALPFSDTVAQTARPPIKVTKTTPSAAKTAKTTVDPNSTLAGVYTKAQATRGRYVYLGACKNCHDAATHSGTVFAQWWKGKQLSELFQYIYERMPKNDPGTLAEEDVADVVAYLLQLNQMPVGKNEIYPSVDSLKKFRIDLKSKGGTTTAKGAGAKP
jgi:mono/diheme cytochrome c family protein